MRADELGRRTPITVFFDRALSTSKLCYHRKHQPNYSVGTQKSSNSPEKCYKPISYYIDIQCCIIGNRLLLAMHAICLLLCGGRDMRHFYRLGLDIPTISVFITVIDIFHTVDTIGLCLLFEHGCYFS